MKEITLTRGKVAIVDDADYERLSQYRWRAKESSKGYFYAVRSVSTPTKYKYGLVYIHREIMGLSPEDWRRGDHINGDTLDNRRSNLRPTSPECNSVNRRRSKSNTSGYKGVVFYRGRWRARIGSDGTSRNLGYFDTPEAAARAYDVAAWKYFGTFARFNFVYASGWPSDRELAKLSDSEKRAGRLTWKRLDSNF